MYDRGSLGKSTFSLKYQVSNYGVIYIYNENFFSLPKARGPKPFPKDPDKELMLYVQRNKSV